MRVAKPLLAGLLLCSAACSSTKSPVDAGCVAACASGLTCQAGRCAPTPCRAATDCASPLVCVGGFCVDDSCYPRCAATLSCVGQICVPNVPPTCQSASDCPAGDSCVGGFCTQTGCNPACSGGEVCLDGVCIPASGSTCTAPYTSCADGAYCANILFDSSNCGGCGVVCPTGQVCNGFGLCAVTCAPPTALCNGHCTDQRTDNANCGACDNTCDAGEACSNRTCATTCAATYATCGSASESYCAEESTDPLNCGGCGQTCSPGGYCNDGGCFNAGVGSTSGAGGATASTAASAAASGTGSSTGNAGGSGATLGTSGNSSTGTGPGASTGSSTGGLPSSLFFPENTQPFQQGSSLALDTASFTQLPNGDFLLVSDAGVLWNANAPSCPGCTLVFELGGNLVLLDNLQVVWSSNTSDLGAGYVLVVSSTPPYLAIEVDGGSPVWAAYGPTLSPGAFTLLTASGGASVADFGNGMQLALEGSGDMVVSSGAALGASVERWRSQTDGGCLLNYELLSFQTDHNLVAACGGQLDGGFDPYWATGTTVGGLTVSPEAPYLAIGVPDAGPSWAAYGSTFTPGGWVLQANNARAVADFGNAVQATLTPGGDLVLSSGAGQIGGGTLLWQSATDAGCPSGSCQAAFTADGDLELSDADAGIYWETGTAQAQVAALAVTPNLPYLRLASSSPTSFRFWQAFDPLISEARFVLLTQPDGGADAIDFGDGYSLDLQPSGDLQVISQLTHQVVWRTKTDGGCNLALCQLQFQGSGNLVLYNDGGTPYWSAGITNYNEPYYLQSLAASPWIEIVDDAGLVHWQGVDAG